MIPLSLTIEGLYSYRKRQTIDFGRLAGAGLFGIFGGVGSGKSAILEAITFALYGKTDRLNASGDSRNYNMMNLKANELYIGFIFSAGTAGDTYLATAKSRRNTKKYDDVKTIERAAYRKQGGDWIPVALEEIENVIGLSYENFKRTVIIPQGQFQEFLQLGLKERTEMMKDLFNLSKYDLFYKVTALETTGNEKIQRIEGQLLQIGDISPERLEELIIKQEQLEQQLSALTENLKILQKQETELGILAGLHSKLQSLTESRELLLQRKDEIGEKEKRLQDYERCVLHFKNPVEAVFQKKQKIAHLAKQLQTGEEELRRLTEGMYAIKSRIDRLQPEFDKKEQTLTEADELGKMARIAENSAAIAEIRSRMANGEKAVNEVALKIEKLQNDIKEGAGEIKSLKSRMPDQKLLADVKSWHTQNAGLGKAWKKITEEAAAGAKEVAAWQEKLKNLYKAEPFTGIDPEATPGEALTFLEDRKLEYKNKIAFIEKEAGRLQVQAGLESYAKALRDGEACPLCGSREHPHKLDVKNVSAILNDLEKEKKKLESAVAACEQHLRLLFQTAQELKGKKENAGKLEKKKGEATEELKRHEALFRWKEYRDPAVPEHAFRLAHELQTKIRLTEERIEQWIQEAEAESIKKEKYRENSDALKNHFAGLQKETEVLTAQIRHLDTSDYKDLAPEVILLEASGKREKVAAMEKEYNNLRKDLTAMQEKADVLRGKSEAGKQLLEEEQKLCLGMETETDRLLKEKGYESIREVKDILALQVDTAGERKEIEQYRQSLAASDSRLSSVNDDIAGRKYDAVAHGELRSRIAGMVEKAGEVNRESGKTSHDISRLQTELRRQAALNKELEALRLRAEDIRTLKNLFKANGFVKYLSRVYLQNLCKMANERFYPLTRQKLSLELTADNGFQVRDFMNGGKVRNIKTLSGGQTFQAALSLALALAGNIRSLSGMERNFFFLDEGFGTLDKESLNIVFETLTSLRKAKRVVGVISHVEEMQQEIESYLYIRSDEERGSIIQASWET
ncbi:MAG: hypothetical protein JXA03_11330 [Bacteroidales bacterium]|nr:hypothetical protein [Bacteroidales bacterium]